MIAYIQPSQAYDPNNEAQFRTQVRQDASRAVRVDEAIASLVWVDEVDSKAYRVTLSGGAFVFTEITP